MALLDPVQQLCVRPSLNTHRGVVGALPNEAARGHQET